MCPLHFHGTNWAQQRLLRRELATYRPGRETEDLLASLDHIPDDQEREVGDLLCRPSLSRDYLFMRVA
jgi:hypothetical protein